MEKFKHKARDVKSGETVIDRSTRFTLRALVRRPFMFIDMDQMANNIKSALNLPGSRSGRFFFFNSCSEQLKNHIKKLGVDHCERNRLRAIKETRSE